MRLLAALLLMGFLNGCVVAPYGPYYQPHYPDGSATLIKEYCRGEAGPPSALRFDVANGVSVTLTTAKSYSQRNERSVPLSIIVNIPSGTTVQFLSDAMVIADSGNPVERKAEASFLVAALVPMATKDQVDMDRSGPVAADVVQRFLQSHPDRVASEAHIDFTLGHDQFHPEAVSLSVPAIDLNGRVISNPPLQLVAHTQDKGWWRYETREHLHAREQRYERCLAETPQLQCKNILQVVDEGFRLTVAGLETSGRLTFADFTQAPKLAGQLAFAFRSVEPWKFTTNEIRAEDVKTGESQTTTFDRFSVFFGWYDVPFATAIKGVHSTPGGNTSIRISSSLGDKYPSRYYIKLPPLLIDGRRFEWKPIELELKLFEGGVQPFNC